MTIIPIKDLIAQEVKAAVAKQMEEITQGRGRISKAPPCHYCQSFNTNFRGYIPSSGNRRVRCFDCGKNFTVKKEKESDRDG
jgi:transposase-like protein